VALTSAEHAAMKRQAQDTRNAAGQERRGNGWGYRKVPVHVEVIETTDAEGARLLLATSDTPAERGRYFAVSQESGRWRCSCGAFRSLNGCHHVGHLTALETDSSAQDGVQA
jgi:hypothetical protein